MSYYFRGLIFSHLVHSFQCLLLGGGLIISNLNAQKIYVAADAETNGNGSSWELPFNNLSDALDQAQHGDTIMLKEGNYLSLSKISPFKLKSGVKLIGGFSGNEDELYQRQENFNHSTITGFYNGLVCIDTDSSTIIDGIRFYKNFANLRTREYTSCDYLNGDFRCFGGGVFVGSWDENQPACLKIRNCIFEENNSQDFGAGLALYAPYNSSAGLWVENTVFLKNKSYNIDGGGTAGAVGILATRSDFGFYFDNCAFEFNEAIWYGAVSFGQDHWEVVFSDCTFRNNKASRRAAALNKNSGPNSLKAKILNCSFIDNKTEPSRFWPGEGGAIFGQGLFIDQCFFQGNVARWGGAITGTDLVIHNTSFIDNFAGAIGGAVEHLTYGNSENMRHHSYVNCTFAGNHADSLCGVIKGNSVSRDTFINCIFYQNSAGHRGPNICYPDAIMRSLHFSNYNYFDTEDIMDAIWEQFINRDSMQIGMQNYFGGLDPKLGKGYDGLLRPGDCSPLIDKGDPNIFLPFDMEDKPRQPMLPSTLGAIEPHLWEFSWHHRDETCHDYFDGAVWHDPIHLLGPVYFQTLQNGAFDTLHLGSGTYEVSALDKAGCIVSTLIEIDGKDEVLVIDSINHASAMDVPDGAVYILEIEGLYPPFSILWNDGSSNMYNLNLLPGNYSVTISDSMGCEKVLDYDISFQLSTELFQMDEIIIWPNPTSEILNIKLGLSIKRWKIIDIFGVIQFHGNVHGVSSFEIETSSLIPGLYFLILTDDTGSVLSKNKFIKS
jgi:hypothetical protein